MSVKIDNQTNKKEAFDFEKLNNTKVSIEEKITSSIFALNNINSLPEITSIFHELKAKKSEAISAYSLLTNSLKEELIICLEDTYSSKLNNLELELKIDNISSYIRQEALKPSNKANTNNEEYKNFLTIYEQMLQISQSIVKNKLRMEVLLESQKLLDSSYSSKMVEIDFQAIKLNEIVNNFQKVICPKLIDSYSEYFSNAKDFKNLIIEKEMQLEEIEANLKSKMSEKVGPQKETPCLSSSFDMNVSNDSLN